MLFEDGPSDFTFLEYYILFILCIVHCVHYSTSTQEEIHLYHCSSYNSPHWTCEHSECQTPDELGQIEMK